MVSKIVSNCQEDPIKYVNLEIPTETQVEGDGDVDSTNTVGTSATCSVFCSLPLSQEMRDILENLDTAPIKSTLHQTTLQKLQQQTSSSSLLNTKKPRKFLCLYCERTFATGSLRFKHEERCHSAKQARRSSSRFQQSPLKATVCFLCPHNNDPPSLCPDDLFRHLLDDHNDMYFGCYECKERFSSATHLQTHREEMHSSSEDLSIETSVSNDLSPSSPPNGTTEDVKLNIEKEAAVEDDEPDDLNRVQLRKRPSRHRKIAFRSAKLGVKRNTRLQAKQNVQTLKKRSVKTLQSDSSASTTPEKAGSSGSSVNSVSLSENPYPAFDAYYRVKKITDHSIDNLRISSLTFDDVFDKAFYNRIKCNIRENLLHHIDGKLFKNKESDARISNFEKGHNRLQSNSQPQLQLNQHQVSASATTENYGCELSLNAATPSSSLSATHQLQTGEDILESQIEYGSKASNGKKKSSGQEEVRFKYLTRRKYQASILESKENRDLSRLDMWTQIVVKNRQQRIADDNKSDKEKSDYKNGEEYKAKKQNEELNRVLDKRGPFEDLKEEANKQAALEGNHLQEAYVHVTSIMEDILSKMFDGASVVEVDAKPVTNIIIPFIPIVPIVQDVPELPAYLNLQRGSHSQPTYIDKSDKISLICSSQEIEGYNDHDTSLTEPHKQVELTGEWARSRMYICAVCGLKVSNMKLLMEHKGIVHTNVWCQHYEFVGNQGELYRHLSIPALGKMGEIETQPTRIMWRRSEARRCSKCTKQCNSLGELHRHVLECGEDWAWMMVRKKCKYRPFGAKTRKKRRGLFKRIVPIERTPGEKRIYKKKFHDGPRQKPSDAETIQRMLANLPAKRATRKIMSLKDGFPSHRKARTTPTSSKLDDKPQGVSSSNDETIHLRKSKSNPVLRSSMRNVTKVIASKIIDTNSALLLRRRLRRPIRNVPKNATTLPTSERTNEDSAIEQPASPEEANSSDEADSSKTQGKSSSILLLRKKVVRKVHAKKVVYDAGIMEKRVTRNATTKVDITEGTSGNQVNPKMLFVEEAIKTGTKLIETILTKRTDDSDDPNESLTDALLENTSIDIIIELESRWESEPEVPAADFVTPEVNVAATGDQIVTESEKSTKRLPKKRRSTSTGTTRTVAKKIYLQNPEGQRNYSESSILPETEVLNVKTDDFLGPVDQIPRMQQTESENSIIVQKTPSLEVLAEEVSKSDACAIVAISELVFNPPFEFATAAVCPKELPVNDVVDLSVQHTSDNVVQIVIPKINSTPLSKRCKRNKGLNDCIAMLTSKLLYVNEEETANTSTKNVSLQSTDVINKAVTNICEPIKQKEHDRVINSQDVNVCDLIRYSLETLPHVNSEIVKQNILKIPPMLNTKLDISISDNFHHRITLPSTIVPIIKIPNYPLKLFGVHEAERNIFRNSEIRNLHLLPHHLPRDLNIYPVDSNNKAYDLVAQDLTMPAIRVPNRTFSDSAHKPADDTVKELTSQKVMDLQPELHREHLTDCTISPEEKMNKPHSDLLNMSTYEMKTITPSTETIISTAEPEILAGNPLPEEVTQKSQMLPIEAAKCDIEENKEVSQNVARNKNVLSDLKEINENLMSIKKYRRPVKPKVPKTSTAARSRSRKKENTLEQNVINNGSIENKIEETEISVLQTNIIQRKSRSKTRNKEKEILPLQNIAVPVDATVLSQSKIINEHIRDDKQMPVIQSNSFLISAQGEPVVTKSKAFTIRNLINASDSDDELPLSKLVKTTIIAPNTLSSCNGEPEDIELYLEAAKIITIKGHAPLTEAISDGVSTITAASTDIKRPGGKQPKKPRVRKPTTKNQMKLLQAKQIEVLNPIVIMNDNSTVPDNTIQIYSESNLPSSVICEKAAASDNAVISEMATISNIDNALITAKKPINRKRGKRKTLSKLADTKSHANKKPILNSTAVTSADEPSNEIGPQELTKEGNVENISMNAALTTAITGISPTFEPISKLIEKESKSAAPVIASLWNVGNAFVAAKNPINRKRGKRKQIDVALPISEVIEKSMINPTVATSTIEPSNEIESQEMTKDGKIENVPLNTTTTNAATEIIPTFEPALELIEKESRSPIPEVAAMLSLGNRLVTAKKPINRKKGKQKRIEITFPIILPQIEKSTMPSQPTNEMTKHEIVESIPICAPSTNVAVEIILTTDPMSELIGQQTKATTKRGNSRRRMNQIEDEIPLSILMKSSMKSQEEIKLKLNEPSTEMSSMQDVVAFESNELSSKIEIDSATLKLDETYSVTALGIDNNIVHVEPYSHKDLALDVHANKVFEAASINEIQDNKEITQTTDDNSISKVTKEEEKIVTGATVDTSVTKVICEDIIIQAAFKKGVNRGKKGRSAKSCQRRKPPSKIPTFNFTENDNAVSPGNIQLTLNNEKNVESDVSKDVESGKLDANVALNISKLFDNINSSDSNKPDLDKDEIDGPTLFTDSSIRTCSIIDATIESAFRIYTDTTETTVADGRPAFVKGSDSGQVGSTLTTVLTVSAVNDVKPTRLEVPVKNRKCSKRPDRKKRRKKANKFRRIPKLKAMKAYIDSVSEDTTSKGLDTPDEQSTSDINLECLLRTNSPSITAEDTSIIIPVVSEGFSTDDNKPSSPISNELPGVCRSDQSSPIEEFATDCNNSFDGLIRSHEPFDVTRDLDGLEVPLIPPLTISVAGILDVSETFDSLASKDLDMEQISKNLDELQANVDPVEEPKIDLMARVPKKKTKKIKKRVKVNVTRKSNILKHKRIFKNITAEQVIETNAIALEKDDAFIITMSLQDGEIFEPIEENEIATNAAQRKPINNIDIPLITIEHEMELSAPPVRKYDSSIYDFDPTSEDLLLDETCLSKSPNKQKKKHSISTDDLLLDEGSLSNSSLKQKVKPTIDTEVLLDNRSTSKSPIKQKIEQSLDKEVLLDERSMSPTKQKLKIVIKKDVVADLTINEGCFSPRRSRSRKSESDILKSSLQVDNPTLQLDQQNTTAEISKVNPVSISHSSSILKDINNENEVNFSPRRSRSRKSETVLVETEVPSNVIEPLTPELATKVCEPTETTASPEIISSNNNSVNLKVKSRLKARQGRAKCKGRKKVVMPDLNIEEKESFCDICNKSFARSENLMKHKRTLTHIAKLSEIEAREAQIKADKAKTLESVSLDVSEDKDDLESIHMDEEDIDDDTDKFPNGIATNCNSEVNVFPNSVPVSYVLPPKLADIISDVLSKPVDLNSFDTLQQSNSHIKRYKSLGERKSFDSETVAYTNQNQFPSHMNEEPMPPTNKTASSILKTQISILENIIENKSNFYINEDSCKSTDSKQSNGRCPSDMSLVSDIKQDDSNIISFSQHSNMNIIEPRLTGNFLKPSAHYEEISEDSTVVRKHFEDQKARKVLNRDEELFLECCSLLKSSSEVSNFSKQSARKAIPSRPVDKHEWLKTNQFYESNSNFHESNPPSNTTEFYSDASRANSPIGNSFIGDMSNSDILRNDWQSENSKFKKADSFEDISLGSINDNTNDNILTKEDSILNKDDVSNLSNDSFSDDFNLDSGSLKNEVGTDPKIEEFAMSMKNALTSYNKNKATKKKSSSEASQTSITDYTIPIVKENADTVSDINTFDRKVITKGARKVFEGLKVSIPTNELNMKEVLSCSPAIHNLNSVDSPVSKKKLSKIGNRLGLKVTKKKNKPKKKADAELTQSINVSLRNSDKIHDVYDFEETQDNTDLFNSNLNKFRSQGSEKNESNLILENSDNDEPKIKPDTPNVDIGLACLSNFSGSESTHSTKQKKKSVNNDHPIANNNNKKKCMIMGRIFKNAFKTRIDLEINDIPCVDNNSLVENYVMNCTNTAEIESRFDKFDKDDKKKMSQEEMDALFDKLLHESGNIKLSKNGSAADSNKMKAPPIKKSTPKTDKPKNGIKRRQRQNSNTSDDEFCITKTQRKKPTKKKVQDNSINLEQELKECMGVAGRKSQRKCTSGKQNVLVEYWSSDDSNFEALINPDFVRRKRDKETKRDKDQGREASEATFAEISPKVTTAPEIELSVLAEIRQDIMNATKHQKVKVKNGVKRKQPKTNDTNGVASKVNRRKRSTGDTLYYWSSSSDDESRDLIEVKPVREEIDEDDEDRPMQHGWIVGDSPKKLVTMLAQAKGKKIDTGVCVKEQPKKRTSL